MKSEIVYTIGHSTHGLDEFIAMLKHYGVRVLADVRTMPGSRRVPAYNRENLAPSLEAGGIQYLHLKALGGLRHTTKESVNGGWRNKSFRGYADYMQTEEFKAGLDVLIDVAEREVTAIMCAEAVPWRCHRSLIGDALLIRGFEVTDIFTQKKASPHKLTPFARVEGGKITYPGPG